LGAVAFLLVSVFLWFPVFREVRETPPATGGAVGGEGAGVVPQDDNVVLYWLESGTPVYFVIEQERRRR
jgi:hypothetical protein